MAATAPSAAGVRQAAGLIDWKRAALDAAQVKTHRRASGARTIAAQAGRRGLN